MQLKCSDDIYWNTFEKRHRPHIDGRSIRLTRDTPVDADDLTQCTFINACRYWDKLHDRGIELNERKWLYRIQNSCFIDGLRRHKPIMSLDDPSRSEDQELSLYDRLPSTKPADDPEASTFNLIEKIALSEVIRDVRNRPEQYAPPQGFKYGSSPLKQWEVVAHERLLKGEKTQQVAEQMNVTIARVNSAKYRVQAAMSSEYEKRMNA